MAYYVPSVQIAQEFQQLPALNGTPLAALVIGLASPLPGDTDSLGNPLRVQVGVISNQTGSTPAELLYSQASFNASPSLVYADGSAYEDGLDNAASGCGSFGSCSSTSEVYAKLGTPAQANPLALGVYNALLNSNGSPVYYIALADDTLDYTGKTWDAAIALAEKTNLPYGLVPVFSAEFIDADTVNALRNQIYVKFEAHVASMSSKQKAKWRTAWFSTPVHSGNTPGTAGSDNYLASLPVSATNWETGSAPAGADSNSGPRRFHNVFPGSYTIPVAASNAAGTVVLSEQGIKSISLSNAGSNYTDAPHVAIVPNASDTTGGGATAVAFVENGSITQIIVTNAGSGYSAQPSVVFTNAVGDTTGAGAAASVTIADEGQKVIQRVSLSANGSGYDSTPSASYSVTLGGATAHGSNSAPTLIMRAGSVAAVGILSVTPSNTASNAYYTGYGSSTAVRISIGTVTAVGTVASVFDGCFMAAALAGQRSGSVPHQSLTNTQLILNGAAQLPDVVNTYSQDTLNWLAQNGVWIVTQDQLGSVTYNRHQITAAGTSNLNYMEDSVTANVDSISYALQAALAPFVGIYNISPAALLKVRATVDNILSYYATNTFTERAGNQLLGYKIDSIAQNATYKDRVDINITLQVPYPMNYINVTLSI